MAGTPAVGNVHESRKEFFANRDSAVAVGGRRLIVVQFQQFGSGKGKMKLGLFAVGQGNQLAGRGP